MEFVYNNDFINVEYEINEYEGKVRVEYNSNEHIYIFDKDIKIIIKK